MATRASKDVEKMEFCAVGIATMQFPYCVPIQKRYQYCRDVCMLVFTAASLTWPRLQCSENLQQRKNRWRKTKRNLTCNKFWEDQETSNGTYKKARRRKAMLHDIITLTETESRMGLQRWNAVMDRENEETE